MPLDLRQAASRLIDAGYSDDEIKGAIGEMKSQASQMMDQGMSDAEITGRLALTRFKDKQGGDIILFQGVAPKATEKLGLFSRFGQEITQGVGQAISGVSKTGGTGILPLEGAADIAAGLVRAFPPFAAGTVGGKILGEKIADIPDMDPNIRAARATAVDIGTQALTGSATGKIARGASGLARKGAAFLPGAGTALREEGANVVRGFSGAMLPSQPSENLFAIVQQMNPEVTLPRFNQMSNRITRSEDSLKEFGISSSSVRQIAGSSAEATGRIKVQVREKVVTKPSETFPTINQFKVAQLQKQLLDLEQKEQILGQKFPFEKTQIQKQIQSESLFPTGALRTTPEQTVEHVKEIDFGDRRIPFSTVQNIRRRLGEKIGSLRNSTASDAQEQLGPVKQLYAALSRDLEQSAEKGVGPAFSALKEANAAARREFVIGEIDDLIQPTLNRVLEGTDRTKTAFAKLLNDIREKRRADPLFASAKDPFIVKNLNDLEGTLDELRKLPISPPPKGVFAGSMVAARRTSAGGLIGGGISSALGMGFQPGAIVGGVSGIAAAEGISKLLQTQGGRHWLLNFVKKEPGGLFNPKNFAMMSTVARAFSMQDLQR